MINLMIEEYKIVCELLGIPHISADEQNLAELSPEANRYIANFLARWEEAQ